jgi:hypothetical protein
LQRLKTNILFKGDYTTRDISDFIKEYTNIKLSNSAILNDIGNMSEIYLKEINKENKIRKTTLEQLAEDDNKEIEGEGEREANEELENDIQEGSNNLEEQLKLIMKTFKGSQEGGLDGLDLQTMFKNMGLDYNELLKKSDNDNDDDALNSNNTLVENFKDGNEISADINNDDNYNNNGNGNANLSEDL